jgi:hypothetical protein
MSASLPRRRRPAGDQESARQGDGDEARLWRIGTALAVSFTVAVVSLAGLAWLAWVLLGAAGFRQHGALSLHDTVGMLQLVFASVAGADALVALIVAYRRQKIAEADSAHDRTRVFNERFTAIAAQLGDAQPAVRLAAARHRRSCGRLSRVRAADQAVPVPSATLTAGVISRPAPTDGRAPACALEAC